MKIESVVDETEPQPSWAERHHLALTEDVSYANQRRYHRAMRNGGRINVIGKRLAGPRWTK